MEHEVEAEVSKEEEVCNQPPQLQTGFKHCYNTQREQSRSYLVFLPYELVVEIERQGRNNLQGAGSGSQHGRSEIHPRYHWDIQIPLEWVSYIHPSLPTI